MVLNTLYQRRWSDPVPLEAWQGVPTRPGLYIIGCAYDERLPIGGSFDSGGKLSAYPAICHPVYIGHSLSQARVLRGRLSCHARARGNRYIAMALCANVPLWSIFISGHDMAEYEAIYLDLPNGIYFPFNHRSETARALGRASKALAKSGLAPRMLEVSSTNYLQERSLYEFDMNDNCLVGEDAPLSGA